MNPSEIGCAPMKYALHIMGQAFQDEGMFSLFLSCFSKENDGIKEDVCQIISIT
jgi:hypothetical protein